MFDNGRVIAAFTTGEKETVGERMLAAGVVAPTAYQEMLAAQAAGSDGYDLFEAFGLEPERLADALQKILETTVYGMFEWDDGTFSFVLEDEPDPWRGFSLVGTRIVSQRGLNPQYLAIEGARIRDERAQEDSLNAFLARDKQKSPGLLTREADVRTFAAKLRESPTDVPERDKVIPFPGGRARRDSVATAAAEAVAEPEAAPEAMAVAVEVPSEPAEVPSEPAEMPSELAEVPSEPAELAAVVTSPEVAAEGEQPPPHVEPEPQPAPVEAPPSEWASPPQATVVPEVETAPWRLLAIDDDPQVTRQLLSAFENRFAAVASSNTVADALVEIENGPPGLVIASDLIIARSDGAGILGGIEILERVRERSSSVPVVLFTDYENAEAQQRAAELGVSGFLMKPRKAQIQGTDGGEVSPAMQGFLDELSVALGPYLAASSVEAPPPAESIRVEAPPPAESIRVEAPPPAESTRAVAAPEVKDPEVELIEPLAGLVSPSAPEPAPAQPPQPPQPPVSPAALDDTAADSSANTGQLESARDDAPVSPAEPPVELARAPIETTLPYDLRREMAGVIEEIDVPGSEDLPPSEDSDGPVSTLRSMLAELVDPANRDTVTLLVLRFASLVFERAALFLVTRRAYIGLGGFALHESSDLFVMRVRRIQIPVRVDSVFAKVIRFQATLRGPLEQNHGNQLLVSGLGNAWPESGAVALPLVSNERVAAILYGDNPSGRKLGSTDTLEIFLQQAGLAMDRVLLERELEEARRRGTE